MEQVLGLKKYPTIAACGLDCGMCPRFYTNGPSRCPGCAGQDFFNKHPSCSFITCCVKKHNLEVCAECPDFPCSKIKSEKEYEQVKGSSSYPPYKNVWPNFKFIRENGIEAFIEQQKKRLGLLEIMLKDFDDGRSRSYFCHIAAAVAPESIKTSLDTAGSRISSEKIDRKDIKSKAKILRNILDKIAR
jgi:hypothetical protein